MENLQIPSNVSYQISLDCFRKSGELKTINEKVDNRDLAIESYYTILKTLEYQIDTNNSIFCLDGSIDVNLTLKNHPLVVLKKITGKISKSQ